MKEDGNRRKREMANRQVFAPVREDPAFLQEEGGSSLSSKLALPMPEIDLGRQ